MHSKRILHIGEGLVLPERISRAAAMLDAVYEDCPLREAAAHVGAADLVVVGFDPSRADSFEALERLLGEPNQPACLLLVEESSLKQLRLPAHAAVDFALVSSSADELAVRMRRLLWPGEEAASSDFITVDSMTINLSTYQVMVDGEPIDFTYLEYALLAFLVTHPGHAYSRDVLLRRVWDFEYYGGSRTVDVHVRRVRAKLGSELAARLETVRGVGYMWSM